jgi:large subunit ribosomal protein L21
VGGYKSPDLDSTTEARTPKLSLPEFNHPYFVDVLMYAIFTDGGRQYKVQEGQVVDIDFRDTLETGDSIEFDRVLAISNEGALKLGAPTVSGAKVTASVVGLEKGEKVYIQKFRRRKNYDKRTGHRQKYTRITIQNIVA